MYFKYFCQYISIYNLVDSLHITHTMYHTPNNIVVTYYCNVIANLSGQSSISIGFASAFEKLSIDRFYLSSIKMDPRLSMAYA
jgi:hypothetical protein